MASNRGSWWADLLAVGLAASVPVGLVAAGVGHTGVRLAAGLPLVLFLPGYAIVSAMYPELREDCDPPLTRETGEGIDRTMRTRVRGMTGVDRLAVAVAISVAVFPGVVLFQYIVNGSFATLTVAGSMGVLTWAFVCIAMARRLRLAPSQRFTVSLGWVAPLYERYFVANSPHMRRSAPHEAADGTDVLLNVVLVCTLLVALTTAAYAFTQPPQSQQFDELAVLTQDGDGEYVAGNYPDDLTGGDTLYVGVANQRDDPQEYVVHATLEVVDADGQVVERDDQARHEIELGPGERRYIEHVPEPSLDGERLRLRYTLDLPGETDRDDADGPHRSVHVWITGAPEGAADDDQAATPTPDEGTPTPEEPTPDEETPTPTEEDDDVISVDL